MPRAGRPRPGLRTLPAARRLPRADSTPGSRLQPVGWALCAGAGVRWERCAQLLTSCGPAWPLGAAPCGPCATRRHLRPLETVRRAADVITDHAWLYARVQAAQPSDTAMYMQRPVGSPRALTGAACLCPPAAVVPPLASGAGQALLDRPRCCHERSGNSSRSSHTQL